jgi:hypothetical protein
MLKSLANGSAPNWQASTASPDPELPIAIPAAHVDMFGFSELSGWSG